MIVYRCAERQMQLCICDGVVHVMFLSSLYKLSCSLEHGKDPCTLFSGSLFSPSLSGLGCPTDLLKCKVIDSI